MKNTFDNKINVSIEKLLDKFLDFFQESKNNFGKTFLEEANELNQILLNEIPLDDISRSAVFYFRLFENKLINSENIKEFCADGKIKSLLNILEGIQTVNQLDSNKIFSISEKDFTEKISSKSKRSKKFATDYDSYLNEQSEYFKHFYISMSGDVRVVLLKLAFHYYKVKNIKLFSEEERFIICRESRYLFAPLAHQLALYNIKTMLEETAMKYLNWDVYSYIANVLAETKASREEYIRNFIKPVKKVLDELGIKAIVKGRSKSIHSIWNKMKKQQVGIDKIYDLFAVRIIITNEFETIADEKAACWQVYSKVTDFWRPNPMRLKDWISAPKASGYESLHTTVIGPDGKWVEVQIRTKRMDDNAEYGSAAHWKYKEIKESVKLGDSNQKKSLLDLMREALESKSEQQENYFQKELYSDILFVYTPKGELRKLDGDGTVLDFAYKIHTQIGNHCTGAKINGKIVGIRHKLTNGDVVEILTSPKQQPKEDWIDIVVSNHARTRIKRALNDLLQERINAGKEILNEIFEDFRHKYKYNSELSMKILTRLRKYFEFDRLNDFYIAIADHKVDIDVEFFNKLLIEPADKSYANALKQLQAQVVESVKDSSSKDYLIIDKNMTGIKYEFAHCCNPIPGDAIFAFVTATRGTKIHKVNCPNASELFQKYPYRVMKATWKNQIADEKFKTKIKLITEQKPGIVATISSIISKQPFIEPYEINLNISENQTYEGTIGVFANGKELVDDFIEKLKQIKGILNIERLNEI